MIATELGCYLARVGDFESAEKIRFSIRQQFGNGRDGRVTIMLMCLEGLLIFYRELGAGALDRLKRACFLSQAMGFNSLTSLSSAWVAHIHFNQNSHDLAVESMGVALKFMCSKDSAALCRASLVLGDMFGYASQLEPARRWYELARNLAVDYGDQATVGALTYNRAALHVHALRMAAIDQPVMDSDVRFADAEVRTAINYQAISGATSLGHLLSSMRVGLLVLEKKFPEAYLEIGALLRSGTIPKDYLFGATLYADLLLCCLHLGRTNEARLAITKLATFDQSKIAIDDKLLIIHCLLEAQKMIDISESCWDVNILSSLVEKNKANGLRMNESLQCFVTIPDRLLRS